mmetsp:Transcript_14210/g.42990  ORF Transcript_14210/g.42990 Transcript_14210/m.42990 type:complete len:345 (+) Transcript_14210:64-1098(+)
MLTPSTCRSLGSRCTDCDVVDSTWRMVCSKPDGIMKAAYRVAAIVIASCTMAYTTVAPRKLRAEAYNAAYKLTLERLTLAAVAPSLLLALIFDHRKVTLRDITQPLFRSFFLAAPIAAVVEAAASAMIWRMLFPTLRELDLPPRTLLMRLRAFVAEFAVTCVVAPVVEEFCKLRSAGVESTKRTELTKQQPIHTVLLRCVSASVGMKFSDGARRISLYSRPWHPQPHFFAAGRGLFPIQELCGALTATRVFTKQSTFGIILPSILLHASATFRGMKPVGKWSFECPWLDLQLQAWNAPDDATLSQVLIKSAFSLMWWGLLLKVLAYTTVQYYKLADNTMRQKHT